MPKAFFAAWQKASDSSSLIEVGRPRGWNLFPPLPQDQQTIHSSPLASAPFQVQKEKPVMLT
jgi:hypothetical protein